VDLTDAAIATSGDYRNFFADGGQRYSHSIDPRTGKPVEHALASVSVVAPSTMTADALSTALMVMGPAEAMDFVEKHAVAAHMILKSGSSLKEEYSSSFEKLLS
jgi:thiamine biosynthesis lipoprotein